jgi:Disulphide bond corrector protein DsbC
MRLNRFFKAAAPLLLCAAVSAQVMAPTMTVVAPPTVKAKKGSVAMVSVKAVLPPGYHANSSTPSDTYLIPLTLKWSQGPLQPDGITYPKPAMEKYSFSDKPLSVVTGEFSITTKFKVPADASTGAGAQNGTLKYQACNDRMCFAPKTLPVTISLNIE